MRGASSRGRGPWRERLAPPIRSFQREEWIRGLVLRGEIELALLLKTRASVVLMQDLELGPVLAQLLRETALRRNWAGPSGLLVLRAGRRRGEPDSP
jgi:hypothetical protein